MAEPSHDAQVIRGLRAALAASDAKCKEYEDAINQAAKDVELLIQTRQSVYEMLTALHSLVEKSNNGIVDEDGGRYALKAHPTYIKITTVLAKMREPTPPPDLLLERT